MIFFSIVIFMVTPDVKIFSCMVVLIKEQIDLRNVFSHFYSIRTPITSILITVISKFKNKRKPLEELLCGKNSN